MTQPPPRRFSGIFISYRREDSAGHTGRLYDRLAAHFGDEQVFMDIDQIEPGEDFVQIIEEAVGSCDVLLAVIGRRWLTAGDDNARRLDNPNDFVRLEIAAALRRDIRVIPVLVQGAVMPRQDELPDDLSALARRHALELSDLRWKHDINQLVSAVERILEQQEARRRQEREAEELRQREEEERRKKEEATRRWRADLAERTAEIRRRREAAEHPPRREDELRRPRPDGPWRLKAESASQPVRAAEEKARPDDKAGDSTARPDEARIVATLKSSAPLSRQHTDVLSVTSPRTQSPSRSVAGTAQKSGGKLFPALIGGGLIGVLSATPVANLLCSLWAVFGGMLAVGIYSRRAKVNDRADEGERLGALAGLFGWLLSIPLSISVNYNNFTVPPELASAARGGAVVELLVLYTIHAVILILFSTIGGSLEARRKD